MNLSDRTEEKVRGALAVLVDATPIGVGFDELTATQLEPSPKRGSGALAFFLAFLVIGLAGGLAVWTTGDIGGTEPGTVESQILTLDEWFQRTQTAAIQIHDSPAIFQGAAGPEPRFDVTTLGVEQRVETLNSETPIDWGLLETVAADNPVISGFTLQSGYIGVARYQSGSPAPGAQTGPHVCTFVLSQRHRGLGCSSVSPENNETVDYGAAIASTDDFEGRPDILTVRTPPEASVVVIKIGGDSYWQRPNGNMATFIGKFADQQIDIVMYDSQGKVLHEGPLEFTTPK